MSIEDATVIDGMGIDAPTGAVVLLISDHLPWADLASHVRMLEAKINGYISFITGQLAEAMPELAGRKVRVELMHQFEPTVDAVSAFTAATFQLEELGIDFAHRSLPTSH